MPLKLQFIPVPADQKSEPSNRLSLFNQIAAMAMCFFMCVTPALAQTAQAPDSPEYSSLEMAATLRDMIELPRVLEYFRQRIFITPEEFRKRFVPQSAWGRDQFEQWEKPWQESFAALLAALRDSGRLAQTHTAAGLRMPIHQQYYQAPEYAAIDRLLYWTSLDMCDDKADEPDCYLVLHLQRDRQGRLTLGNIQVVRPDVGPVAIPGKGQ